jgi:hypothetical protein
VVKAPLGCNYSENNQKNVWKLVAYVFFLGYAFEKSTVNFSGMLHSAVLEEVTDV